MPFFQIPIWRHQGSRGGTKQTGTPNLLGWTYEPRTIGHLRKDSNPPTAGPRSDPPAPGAPLHCVFPLNKNILIEPQKLSKLKINIDRVLLPTQQIFLKFYWLSHWCLWKQMQKKKTNFCSQIQSGKSMFHLATLSLHPSLIWNGVPGSLTTLLTSTGHLFYRIFSVRVRLMLPRNWARNQRPAQQRGAPYYSISHLLSGPKRARETYCPIPGMLTVISWWRDHLPAFSSISLINQKVSWEDIYAASQPTFPFVLASINDP